MDDPNASEQFVQQLTENQNRIYGYVFSLLGDHHRAADVVQETNLVLWRKVDQYDSARAFLPWAFGIARFQVLAAVRDQRRDRLLLDAELVAILASEVDTAASQMDVFRESLRPCLKSLTRQNREMIEHRYFESESVATIAQSAGRTVGAVKVALMRVRRHLADCVEKRLAAEAS